MIEKKTGEEIGKEYNQTWFVQTSVSQTKEHQEKEKRFNSKLWISQESIKECKKIGYCSLDKCNVTSLEQMDYLINCKKCPNFKSFYLVPYDEVD